MDNHLFKIIAWQSLDIHQKRQFGQRFLSPKRQQVFFNGIELLNSAPLMFGPVNQQKNPTDESPNDFYWRLETVETLFDPIQQNKLLDCCKTDPNRESALQLINEYKAHGRFAHFQSSALLYVFNTLLPPLIKMVYHSQKQLSHSIYKLIIPNKFYRRYRDYLFYLQDELEKMKSECLNAMLARVQLALNSPNFQNDDVLLDFIYSCRIYIPNFISEEQLRLDEDKKITRSLPKKPRSDITKKQMLEMIHLIFEQGNKQQCEILNQNIKLFKPFKRVSLSNKTVFLMKEFSEYLQHYRYYPGFLNPGKKVISSLYSSEINEYLLTQKIIQIRLHKLTNHQLSLDELLTSSFGLNENLLEILQQNQKILEQHLKQIKNSFLKGFWLFLDNGKTNQLLQRYYDALIQHRFSLLQDSIKVLNNFVVKISKHRENIQSQHIKHIEDLLTLCFDLANSVDSKETITQELQKIKANLNHHLNPQSTTIKSTEPSVNNVINQIPKLMQKLQYGEMLEDNEQQLLFFYLSNLRHIPSDNRLKFMEKYQSLLTIAKQYVEKNVCHIENWLEQDKVNDNQYRTVLQMAYLIKYLGNSEDQENLNRQIEHLLLEYLNKAKTQYNHPAQVMRESFVVHFGTQQQKELIENAIKIKNEKIHYIEYCQRGLHTLRENAQESDYVYSNYLKEEVFQCDDILFNYLRNSTKPALTDAQLKVFTDIRDNMVLNNITQVHQYPNLSDIQKVLLGFKSSKPSIFSGFSKNKTAIMRSEIINISAHMRILSNQCDKNTDLSFYLKARKKLRMELKLLSTKIPALNQQLYSKNNKLNFCLDPIPHFNATHNIPNS